MTKWLIILMVPFLALAVQSPALSEERSGCDAKDKACQAFAKMAEQERFDSIIAQVDSKKKYSAAARSYIAQAYLMAASRETNTPDQEEAFCLKALEYGAVSAYMGLYFIHADTDERKALDYLRQYIATQPRDSVPYVILGEAELEQGNYAEAYDLLLSAHKVSRGISANLDWMLFQSSYLTGKYEAAAGMLDQSFSHGKTLGDLRALIETDSRFSELPGRNEFRRFSYMINDLSTGKRDRRS